MHYTNTGVPTCEEKMKWKEMATAATSHHMQFISDDARCSLSIQYRRRRPPTKTIESDCDDDVCQRMYYVLCVKVCMVQVPARPLTILLHVCFSTENVWWWCCCSVALSCVTFRRRRPRRQQPYIHTRAVSAFYELRWIHKRTIPKT